MESPEDDQLERVDSELQSTSSGLSSILSAEDSRSSSGDISTSSGDVAVELTVTAGSRQKCVGRRNRGVRWGMKSVIGRRREMEDSVSVVPGFMSGTCNNVGGCMAPASRTSSEVSPIHFFGVYDGHGGSQVFYVILLRFNNVNIFFFSACNKLKFG